MMNRTRIITEGASAVLLIILLLILTFVPVVGSFSLLFLPIPIMYFASKHGVKPSLLVFLCAIVVAIVIIQVVAAAMATGFLLIGLVMGAILFRKGSVWQLLIGGSLSNIVVLLAAYGVASLVFHFNPVNWMTDTMQNSMSLTLKMNHLFHGDPSAIKDLQAAIANIGKLVPGMIIMVSVFYAFIIELISGAVLKRLRVPFPKWPPLRELRFPRQLMWYYVAALLLELLGGTTWGPGWSMVTLNVLFVFDWVVVIQGLSFVFFFFYQRNQRLMVPILITIFSLVIPILLYIVRILGIIDLGFDLRSRIVKK